MSGMDGLKSPSEISRLQGKKAIRSFARKLAEPEVVKDLNITPMMDMMTIILVFLLKTFTSATAMVTQDSNLFLAPSNTPLQSKEAIPVTITKRGILADGELVAPVSAGRVDPTFKRDGENGYYITQLVEILTKHSNRERKISDLSGQKFEGELQIVADKSTPYRLLTEVLYSCGQAGYSNYRLVVLKTSE